MRDQYQSMESRGKDHIYLMISALDGEREPMATALIDWCLGVWLDADVEFGEKCGAGRELPGLSLPLLVLLAGVSPNRGSNACRCMVPISDCPRFVAHQGFLARRQSAVGEVDRGG
jgi:hypothetical protein